VLGVRLAAPPVDGRANQALVETLAAALGIPRSRVTIVSGQSSRQKVVLVETEATREVVAARLRDGAAARGAGD